MNEPHTELASPATGVTTILLFECGVTNLTFLIGRSVQPATPGMFKQPRILKEQEPFVAPSASQASPSVQLMVPESCCSSSFSTPIRQSLAGVSLARAVAPRAASRTAASTIAEVVVLMRSLLFERTRLAEPPS